MSNLLLIEEYLKDLEQDQMDVANATHTDPDSAEEGKINPYEHNPHLQKYRINSAIIKNPNKYKNLVKNTPAASDPYGIKPIFRQEEVDVPSVSAQNLSDVAKSGYIAATEGVPGFAKSSAGGLLQSLGTPGERQSFGPMRGLGLLTDTLKSQYGQPIVDYGKDLFKSGREQQAAGRAISPNKMVYDVTTNVINMVPTVAMMVGTKNPALALSPIFAQVYGDKFAQSRSEGRSPEEAHMDGMAFGGSEVLSEALPLGFITKAGGNWVWRAAKSGIAEGIQEPVNQIIQNLYDIGVLDKSMSLDEIIGGIKHSAEVGGISGVILSALTAPFIRLRGGSSTALDVIPGEDVGLQGQAPTVAPSATGEPIDIRRRQFLGKIRDIASAAATVRPTDLLPNLVPEAAVEAATAAIPAGPIILDYANIPVSTNYVFEAGGKRVIAMTPHFSDIEKEPYIQLEDEEGGSDNLPNDYGGPDGENNVIDLREYLEPGKEVSQRSVDRAVALAVRDKLMQEDSTFVLLDVERYYDEMGNNADYPQAAEIENHETQNDPEGIFDEVIMGGPEVLTPMSGSLEWEKRVRGREERLRELGRKWQEVPSKDKPLAIEDQSNWSGGPSSAIESRLNRDIEREIGERPPAFEYDSENFTVKGAWPPQALTDRIEEVAKTKELTDQIPGLNELTQQLKSARDRLKSLEAGIPPEGFEDDYSAEEIAEDIEIEKTNIETIEEEIAIKEKAPLDVEPKVVEIEDSDDTVVGHKPTSAPLINTREELKDKVLELHKSGVKVEKIKDLLKTQVVPSRRWKSNLIKYRGGTLREEIRAIIRDEGLSRQNKRFTEEEGLRYRPLSVDPNDIPYVRAATKEIRRLGIAALEKKSNNEELTDEEEIYIIRLAILRARENARSRKSADKKREGIPSGRKWWEGADEASAENQEKWAQFYGRNNFQHAVSYNSKIWQKTIIDGKEQRIKGAKPVGTRLLASPSDLKIIEEMYIEAMRLTIKTQKRFDVDHIVPGGNPRMVDGEAKGGYIAYTGKGSPPKGVGLTTLANLRIIEKIDNVKRKHVFTTEDTKALEKQTTKDANKQLKEQIDPDATLKSLGLAFYEGSNAYQDPEAGFIDRKVTDPETGRTIEFIGKEHLPGVDYDKIIDKLLPFIKGRTHKIGTDKDGNDVFAKVQVSFVYIPNVKEELIIVDPFLKHAQGMYGIAQDARGTGLYKIAINLARFDGPGIEDHIDSDARRADEVAFKRDPEKSVKKLQKSIDESGDSYLEYSIASTLLHEFTHVNHMSWERELFGRSGHDFQIHKIGAARAELYLHLRPEILKFLQDEGPTAFQRFQLGKIFPKVAQHYKKTEGAEGETNLLALKELDILFHDASQPVHNTETLKKSSHAMWVLLTELLAYQSSAKLSENWIAKIKRFFKMILRKMGINVNKVDLDAFADNINSNNKIDETLLETRILRGEKVPLSQEQENVKGARLEKVKLARMSRSGKAILLPNKLDKTLKIAKDNDLPWYIIDGLKENIPIEQRVMPAADIISILQEHTDIDYGIDSLTKRINQLAEENEHYNELVAMVETIDLLMNIDIEDYGGREDIPIGNTVVDLGSEIDSLLDIEEDVQTEPYRDDDGNLLEQKADDNWLAAWAEPKNKNKDNIDSDSLPPRPPTEKEATDYTGGEPSRPKARERTTLRSIWGYMFSQATQTVRRHSGAAPSAGVLADLILRAPHEKLREKETRAGLDLVQKKSMALGEFRFKIQRALDELTNRRGVIPLKVNKTLKEFFDNGIIPENRIITNAAENLKKAIEDIYVWSDKVGKTFTEDFSLRPLDGGVLPRVYDVDVVASKDGRIKLLELLNSIGIKDEAAIDAYNIILNSGGFVSGDFTSDARLEGEGSMKTQQELFEKVERELSRDQMGDLLLNDFQAVIPRFIDKAIEKTVYAEIFGHRNENLNKLKEKIRKEVIAYNRKNPKTLININNVTNDVDRMIDILNHRYKVDMIPTKGRKAVQAAMNATTVASLTLVTLASMPEFFTATALGSKNPAKFATNFMGAATFAALRGLNGINKLLTGRMMKGYFDPKTKVGKRAVFLRNLGLYDLSNLGEAAATRYVGPSFIKSGVGSTQNSFNIKALYKLYGLGNLEKGRFRARNVRALINMDTYFEITLLTTLTQMQQMMALKNLTQVIGSDAKALSKAKKGKGLKLKSTIAQIKSNLKTYGLSESELDELVRWYEAGHRELYDVPSEFNLDLAGPAHRFVQSVVTLPNVGSLPIIFRNPAWAPFLLFKSFITTFGNTFLNTIAQRIRFAEGKGTGKKYQQTKQVIGMGATAAAMYGAVLFALSIRYLIQYGDDENPWEEKLPDWANFIQKFERTGLLGPLGSAGVQVAVPDYWSWKGDNPWEKIINYGIGPIGKEISNVLQIPADLARGKDLDLEGRLAKAMPLTKSTPIREALGIDPYYTEDKKGKLIRKRTLERREEKKVVKKEAKRQELLSAITDDVAKRLNLSKEQIVNMDRRELDRHMRTKLGFDPDGRKSKASMINQYLKSKGADESSFLKSEESESYKRKHGALQKVRESAKERYKGMTTDERRKEYLATYKMSKKQFDEYAELEYGIILDGRKSRNDMNVEFLNNTKGFLKD